MSIEAIPPVPAVLPSPAATGGPPRFDQDTPRGHHRDHPKRETPPPSSEKPGVDEIA